MPDWLGGGRGKAEGGPEGAEWYEVQSGVPGCEDEQGNPGVGEAQYKIIAVVCKLFTDSQVFKYYFVC